MADSSRQSVMVFLRLPDGDEMLALAMTIDPPQTVDAAVR
jgi:hypothetical protein